MTEKQQGYTDEEWQGIVAALSQDSPFAAKPGFDDFIQSIAGEVAWVSGLYVDWALRSHSSTPDEARLEREYRRRIVFLVERFLAKRPKEFNWFDNLNTAELVEAYRDGRIWDEEIFEAEVTRRHLQSLGQHLSKPWITERALDPGPRKKRNRLHMIECHMAAWAATKNKELRDCPTGNDGPLFRFLSLSIASPTEATNQQIGPDMLRREIRAIVRTAQSSNG